MGIDLICSIYCVLFDTENTERGRCQNVPNFLCVIRDFGPCLLGFTRTCMSWYDGNFVMEIICALDDIHWDRDREMWDIIIIIIQRICMYLKWPQAWRRRQVYVAPYNR